MPTTAMIHMTFWCGQKLLFIYLRLLRMGFWNLREIKMNYDDLSVHGLTLESYQGRIEDLENALQEIIDLARTGLPIQGMTDEQWKQHKLNRIVNIANRAKSEEW